MIKTMALYLELLLIFMLSLADGKVSRKLQGGSIVSPDIINHQVSIQINNEHICSGIIIGEHYVLTAATCIVLDHDIILGNIKVRAGSNDLLDNDSSFLSYHEVSLVIIHPTFNIRNFWSDDICILKLSTGLDLFYIRPAKLPLSKLIKNILQISGWSEDVSHTSDLISTQRLKRCNIERPRNCNEIFGTSLNANQFCGYGSPRSCYLTLGDGGNPLFFYRTIFGVVSLISSYDDSPFIYTQTFNYNNWIDNILHNY
ncbi:hypothetical protein HCN44_011336 [Aphidius gifuensis]|uniref:Peptidase S1 domain-containing protein n=1 Tax=Aphidius gifuensis TaxID=684658 RepID=A0A835CS84_APHGI|nr:hypothetical protein HCN44_011336 [Aphidius gifuensis]